MRTAAEARHRLEHSRLYLQRQKETRQTKVMARVAALWYMDGKFRERYWVDEKKVKA